MKTKKTNDEWLALLCPQFVSKNSEEVPRYSAEEVSLGLEPFKEMVFGAIIE